jgi:ribose 5-phosphate isomerase B
VTAEGLVGVPDGGSYALPHGAVVTPLARDEARRRGIRLAVAPGTPGAFGASAASARVAVGSDHGGFALKTEVLAQLRELGYRPLDLGTRDTNSVDYPDYARAVAEAVARGQCDFGIVIDGAGIGSAIAANKVPGARAATCCDERMAANAREHNHANVLSLGSGWVSGLEAHAIVRTFLGTEVGGGRHARRARKIDDIERRYSSAGRSRSGEVRA